MKIAIRKEPNGSIYIDKTALQRFDEETLKQPPYNYSFVEVEKEDCEPSDFNDDLTFSTEKYNARKLNTQKNALRLRRETECFPIINRGQLWYDTLTDEQKTELKEWYIAWLNLPNNYPTNDIIPQKPSWIN